MFLHSYRPHSILFDFGFVQIHWYGFLIALGAVTGFFIFYKLARRAGFDKNIIFNLFFYLIIWGLIGGRLYHVLSEFNYYFYHPLEIFFIWQGGLGIYGSLISGIITVLYFAKKIIKTNSLLPYYSITLLLLDLLSPALALAQAIGRWGNYFNRELYGWPTNLPWGIPIDPANRVAGYENFDFFHPVFLYESLLCFLAAAILNVLLLKKVKHEGPHGYKPGTIFFLYILLYSLWRFFIEFLRLDSQPAFLSLRLGQWVSLGLIICLGFLCFLYKKYLTKSKNVIK